MSRLVTVALLLLGAVTIGAAPASADVTVPGCFGAVVVYCDPTVATGYDVETYDTTVPVCAGTCVDVPVKFVRVTGSGSSLVCVTLTPRGGTPQTTCDEQVSGAVSDYVNTKVGEEEETLVNVLSVVCHKVEPENCSD